jgi:sulfatase maturation enzyme AslB (radical SAM superfamily)
MAVITPEQMEAWTSARLRSLQEALPLEFPFALDIESTNACNLDCFFCPRKEAEKGIGMMDFGLFTRLVDECAEQGGVRKIGLHKDGEPLAHPRIVEMVAYIRDRRAAQVISFTSNGILMKPAKARALLDAGLNDVSFSIDAVEADTYRRTKGRDKYRAVEENVRRFLQMKPPLVKATVKFIRMKESLGQEQAFIEQWRDSGADVLVTEYHDWSGSVRDSSLFQLSGSAAHACENPWYALAVNWDGKVSICCVDWDSQGVVGDANLQTLHAIWHGEELRHFRELHLDGRAGCVAPCATCTYKNPRARAVIGGWLMANRDRVMARPAPLLR